MLLGVDNRRERGGDHHTLNGRGMGLDGLEDTRGAFNRRVEEVLDGVLHVVVEGRCRMQDVVERGVTLHGLFISLSSPSPLDSSISAATHLVKSTVFRDVLDDDVGQLVRRHAGMVAQDLLALVVRTNSENDVEAAACYYGSG